jgi:hypothetical protein
MCEHCDIEIYWGAHQDNGFVDSFQPGFDLFIVFLYRLAIHGEERPGAIGKFGFPFRILGHLSPAWGNI